MTQAPGSSDGLGAAEKGLPLVSVVVPVFNTDAFLRDCVDSVLSQTYRNVEVILIDDGSTDTSPSLCDSYARADTRVRVVHQLNAGLSEARNVGLRHSTGAYVMYLDSDDWLDLRCIEVLHALVSNWDAEIAMCGTAREASPGEGTKMRAARHPEEFVSGDDFLRDSTDWPSVHPVSAWAKLIARGLLDSFCFPPGRLHEDVFATHEILHKARRVAVTQQVLHYYRARDGSITSGAMSMKSASDKARAHLEKAASLHAYGLEEVAGLEFRRGLGWHLRVRAATRGGAYGLQTELAGQRALIEQAGSRIRVGPATRLTLLAYSVFPGVVARGYNAVHHSPRGGGFSHDIQR